MLIRLMRTRRFRVPEDARCIHRAGEPPDMAAHQQGGLHCWAQKGTELEVSSKLGCRLQSEGDAQILDRGPLPPPPPEGRARIVGMPRGYTTDDDGRIVSVARIVKAEEQLDRDGAAELGEVDEEEPAHGDTDEG